MPYQIRWLVDQQVLLSTFQGDLSRDEFLAFIDEVLTTLRSSSHRVYHISDSRKLGKVGLSLKAFQDLLKSFSLFTELGWQVDINKPGLNSMLAAIASQFVHVRTKTVPSLLEAIEFLSTVAPDLSEMLNDIQLDEDTTLPIRPESPS